MKKFVFTLAALLKVKEALKKQQQAEMARIVVALNQLQDQRQALQNAFERESEDYQNAARKGVTPQRMDQFVRYFAVLRERQKQVDVQIVEKQQQHRECQQKLVKTMQEKKMLEKLREKQWEEYRLEVARDESLQIGDFVNFQLRAGSNE